MSKLGQFLVELGWITGDDLIRAIHNQQLVGGRLGTCLLEMDVLSEDLLLQALSHQLKVPWASVSDLHNIPSEVISLLPAKVAIRNQAIPFRMLGGEIYIAMLEVKNLAYHDEISFVTGKNVKAHIANEARIFEALASYYDQACPSRFRQLLTRLNRSHDLAGQETPQQETPTAVPALDRGTEPVEEIPAPDLTTPAGVAAAALVDVIAESPSASAPRGSASAEALDSVTVAARPSEDAYDTGKLAGAELTKKHFEDGFSTLFAELEAASSRDEVGGRLVDFLSRMFERVALFIVRRDEVVGWMGRGRRLSDQRLKGFHLDFNRPSVFLNLREGGLFYVGPLPPMPSHKELAKCWGGGLPEECVVLPVRIRDRLVSVIYGDRGTDTLAGIDLEQLRQTARHTGTALENCILRGKQGKA